jgi:type I restriction enzyme, S subunit
MSELSQPTLRFKSFKDSWQDTPITNIAEIVGGGTPSTNNNEYWNGSINWFTPTEIINKYAFSSQEKITELGLHKSSAKMLPVGSILFTSRASIANISISTEECSTNQGFQSFIVKDYLCRDFVYYSIMFNEKKFHRFSQGSTFKEVYKKDILKIIFKIPSITEQQKIACFLSVVDKKIKLLTKKLELLERYKKGIMQKIFSQEVRFKQDDGTDFSDWKSNELNQIFQSKRGSGITKDEIEGNGKYKCILYGELYTKYNENIKNVLSKTDIDGKVKSKSGDLLIPCSTTTSAIDLAVSSCVNEENIRIGGDITILRLIKDFSPLFFSYYLTHYKKKEIAKFAQGTTIVHLYYKHFQKIELHVPVSEVEQQKIASFLSAVDKKIDLTQQQIEKTQNFKKGLLQQMFV